MRTRRETQGEPAGGPAEARFAQEERRVSRLVGLLLSEVLDRAEARSAGYPDPASPAPVDLLDAGEVFLKRAFRSLARSRRS